jgi:hypothetical protein
MKVWEDRDRPVVTPPEPPMPAASPQLPNHQTAGRLTTAVVVLAVLVGNAFLWDFSPSVLVRTESTVGYRTWTSAALGRPVSGTHVARHIRTGGGLR